MALFQENREHNFEQQSGHQNVLFWGGGTENLHDVKEKFES
jgi:hypothetical protein